MSRSRKFKKKIINAGRWCLFLFCWWMMKHEHKSTHLFFLLAADMLSLSSKWRFYPNVAFILTEFLENLRRTIIMNVCFHLLLIPILRGDNWDTTLSLQSDNIPLLSKKKVQRCEKSNLKQWKTCRKHDENMSFILVSATSESYMTADRSYVSVHHKCFIPLCCISFSFKHLKLLSQAKKKRFCDISAKVFFFLCAIENVHKNKWVETQMYFPNLLFFCFRSTFTSFLSNKLLCRGLWLRCLRYSSSMILGFTPSLHSLAATDGCRSLSTVLITLGFAIKYFLDKKNYYI